MPGRLCFAALVAIAPLCLSLNLTLTFAQTPEGSTPEGLTPESAAAEIPAESSPGFNRDVRPILSDHCFACHGPDVEQRKAGLRLDTEEGLFTVVEPSDAESSELILRVISEDSDMVMPPPSFHKPLSESQTEILQRWVAAGAPFQQHWAYVPPQRLEIPAEKQVVGQSPIDFFINRALAEAGLKANPIAGQRTLLRRVCLDLTGLPPTRQQMDEFLSDRSPDAYEKLVDRLLDSPRYGEHVGRYWLDLVRYADTHGLHLDNYREMWPYRDWVIEAFNRNMPFDEFVKRQLAGDLLPDAGRSEKIASGFNRLNVTTNEGGSIYEEVFARNCIDRTDAFGTIFLGMTTGCAVCHDHKFDPITQQDYYSLLAFFNSLDGSAMDANVKDPAPVIPVPSPEHQAQLAEYDRELNRIEQEMQGPIESVDQAQQRWEQSLIDGSQGRYVTLLPTQVKSAAGAEMKTQEDGTVEVTGDVGAKDTTTIIAPLQSDILWQTLQLEATTGEGHDRVGLSSNGNVVLSEIRVSISDSLSGGDWVDVPISHAFADVEQQNGPFAVSYAIDGKVDADKGWAVAGHEQTGGRSAWFVLPSLQAEGEDARIRIQLSYQSKFSEHQFRRVRLAVSDSAPTVPADQRVTIGDVHTVGPFEIENPNPGYGRKFASQQSAFDEDENFRHRDRDYRWQHRGDLREIEVNALPTIRDRASVTVVHQRIHSPKAQQATLLIGADDGYVVYLNGKELGRQRGPSQLKPLQQEHQLSLKKGDNDLYIKVVNHNGPSKLTYAFRSPAIPVPQKLVQLLQVPSSQRSDQQVDSLRKYYRSVYCLHPDWLALVDQQQGIRKAKEKLQSEIPTTLVWKETEEPRQAHILKRGQYDQPGEAVERATPSFLPPFPEDAAKDRLGLAKWLLQPDHPLTSRVAVNRFWQQLFGTGLVKTSEDFGSQGQPPSHPDLLDWLAVEFRESGWDIKHLLKTMVMSDAYRRSAEVSPSMRQVDPGNRLLARGPRHRLDGEILRDQALSLSGLLVHEMGGPSVKPPQPDGLWKAVGYSGSNTVKFSADSGKKVYRRSVYTFWKRTSPPPQMSTFDAPSREACTARRERTNTPLQALLLMNEPQYLEASHHLAKRMLNHQGLEDAKQQMRWLFETVTARLPSEKEEHQLLILLDDLSTYYHEQPNLATELIDSSDAGEAAWTVIASTLLNLDEVVSK